METKDIMQKAIYQVEDQLNITDWFIDNFNIDPLENGYTGIDHMICDHVGVRTAFILSPEFAKVFFGEFKVRYYNRLHEEISEAVYRNRSICRESVGQETINRGWKHHLQTLVLEKNRVKYLEKFLK